MPEFCVSFAIVRNAVGEEEPMPSRPFGMRVKYDVVAPEPFVVDEKSKKRCVDAYGLAIVSRAQAVEVPIPIFPFALMRKRLEVAAPLAAVDDATSKSGV